VFFIPLQKHCDGSCFCFFPQLFNFKRYGAKIFWSCWTVCSSYRLKGPSDVFSFFGRPSKFAWPLSTNPRQANDECTQLWWIMTSNSRCVCLRHFPLTTPSITTRSAERNALVSRGASVFLTHFRVDAFRSWFVLCLRQVHSKAERLAVPAASLLCCLGKAHVPHETQYNQGKKRRKSSEHDSTCTLINLVNLPSCHQNQTRLGEKRGQRIPP
jgi:hypothetical protein